MNVLELVEWFEDVSAGSAGTRTLTLASDDAASRLATLRSFYQGLASHPRFSGTWPVAIPSGALHPVLQAEVVAAPLRFAWVGVCATREPAAEAVQVAAQLKAIGRIQGSPGWLREASYGELEAALGPHLMPNAGELTSHAFAFLGQPIGGRIPVMTAATRALDRSLPGPPLLDDGGALQVDAPRARARALVAAGWLERLSAHVPVVLAVDAAQHAGPFLLELVETVLSGDGRILVVLAGEPGAAPSDGEPSRVRRRHARNDAERAGDAAAARARLAGPFRHFDGEPVTAVSLPGGAAGTVTALLATAVPRGLFTVAHVEQALVALGGGDTGAVLDELTSTGWARRVTPEVFAFTSEDRRHLAETQARASIADDRLTGAVARIRTLPAARSVDPEALTTLVEFGAAAHPGATHDERWRFAQLLGAYGEIDRAAALVRNHATDQAERAVLAAWDRACGTGGGRPAITAAGDATATAATLVLEAACVGSHDPRLAAAKLARALQLAGAEDGDALGPGVRVRLAAARVFLSTGDLAGADRALGDDFRRWLSLFADERLRSLSPWRALPGVVARTSEVLANLTLIETLRDTVPGSAALAHALLARLELLERLGRLDTADDALHLALEAARILASGRQRRADARWRAVVWLAWANQRRGDVATALGLLGELIAEQTAQLGEDHPAVLASRQWRARCLVEAERDEEAHADIDAVLHHRQRLVEDDDADLIAAHHWHGTILTRLGRCDEAAEELTDVVARRERLLAPDDEELLHSRLRLGYALAGAGRQVQALRQYREVIGRRSLLDIEDAPRLLAARHARAVCLMTMQRPDEALIELDQVLDHRAAAMQPDAPLLVDVRADRAACLMLLGQYAEAVPDLDHVIDRRSQRMAAGDPNLILCRQQRAIARLATGATGEALAEIDDILAVTGDWPADHPMLASLRDLRRQLVGAAPGF